jgi:hypothetical protein
MRKTRRIFALLLVLCLLPLGALASNFYIFPESNRRRLTREEVWSWQYDALGYAFNELFARYGRPFNPGEKYDAYFQCQTWYKVDPYYPGDGPVLSNIEWANYTLIKDARAQMRAQGTTNPSGKPLPKVKDDRVGSLLPGFTEVYMKPNQKLPVYDGPGTQFRRGANGKAMVSTNGRVYAAGWEDGSLMVMYEVNTGGVRVGFAPASSFSDKINLPVLNFSRVPAQVQTQGQVTEDPVRALTPIATLSPGTPVIWLNRYYHRDTNWDYVEFSQGAQLMRGFVPLGMLAPIFESDPEVVR